jgi:imidazolonepropionase-like amidohydrolase
MCEVMNMSSSIGARREFICEARCVGVAVLCFLLGACGSGEESAPAPAAQVAPTAAPPAPAEPARTDLFAFTHVDVVPLDQEGVLPDQNVIVSAGLITAVGPAAETAVPPGATEIDGTGRFLMPGLAEMHGHLPRADMPAQVAEDLLFLFVANGVTTVRGMQGDPKQFELRGRIERGELVGPRLVLGSPAIGGGTVASAEDAARLVREHHAAGFELIKVHEGLSTEAYAALVATATELGIPFAGHVPDAVGLLAALEARQATIEHLDNYVEALAGDRAPPGMTAVGALLEAVDMTRLDALVEATRASGAAVVPTMVVWEDGLFPTRGLEESKAARPELVYAAPGILEGWLELFARRSAEGDVEVNRKVGALRREILRALHRGGVRILLGSDAPQVFNVPGFSIHREMRLYVEEGMTPYEVLASGSRHVAEHLGAADRFGTVAPGREADLVLLEGNPLEDIGNAARIAGVMARGRWLAPSEIRARLDEIAERYR